jgi:hypothetical protein
MKSSAEIEHPHQLLDRSPRYGGDSMKTYSRVFRRASLSVLSAVILPACHPVAAGVRIADLTLVDARSGSSLDMGTPFDTFSSAAHTAHATGSTLKNRLKLKRLMESEGFVNYQEWWHYSFNAPNPVRFDRVIH